MILIPRIQNLKSGIDSSGEVDLLTTPPSVLPSFTTDPEQLEQCNVFIITVPTPVDSVKSPDLAPLEEASRLVGKFVQEGDCVILESTVYPELLKKFVVRSSLT